MKANELQIGDWVSYKNHVGLVSSLTTNGVCVDFNNSFVGADDSEITPVPLTEKILKANGFKKLDLTIGNYALKLEEKEKYDIHTILWGGVFNGRMEFKVIGEYIHIDKKIRYVHELQHALRLCGLNDLADCFKVE